MSLPARHDAWWTVPTECGRPRATRYATGGPVGPSRGRPRPRRDIAGEAWRAVWKAPALIGSLSRPTAAVGWLVAGNRWWMATSLWETSDGGLHWQRRADPCGGGVTLTAVSFPRPAVGRALCVNERGAGFQAKAVYGTSDGGAVWHLLARAGMPPAASRSGRPAIGYGVALAFPTPGEGFILAGGGAGGDVSGPAPPTGDGAGASRAVVPRACPPRSTSQG